MERFSKLAAEWWNPNGKFRPLHKFNPVRLSYIRDQVAARFGRDPHSARPFEGLRFLDIGCGGGLLCEPMARLGAEVVGADASETNIEVAKLHAAESRRQRSTTARRPPRISPTPARHSTSSSTWKWSSMSPMSTSSSPSAAQMVKPGGIMFVATINRTLKALGLAIVGAEYVLRWLPRGTHQYGKLVRPEELERALSSADMSIIDRTGVIYHPLADRWQKSTDMDVNYMVLAEKAPQPELVPAG